VFADAFRCAEAAKLEPAKQIDALLGRLDALGSLFDDIALRDVTRRLLAVQEAAGDRAAAMLTRVDLGYLETILRNPAEAIPLLREAVQYFESCGAGDLEAQAEARLANACFAGRQLNEAMSHAVSAQAHFRQAGDMDSLLENLQVLSGLYLATGDFDTARDCIEEALALGPDALRRAVFTACRAVVHEGVGEIGEALKLHLASATCFRGLGDRYGQSEEWLAAARLLARVGRAGDALALCDLVEEAGGWHPAVDAKVRTRRADAAIALGAPGVALARYQDGISLASALPDPGLLFEGHAGVAAARLALGDPAGAKAAASRALAVMGRMTAGLSPLRAALTGQGVSHLAFFSLTKRIAFAQPAVADTFDLLERTRAGTIDPAAVGGRAPVADPELARRYQAALERFEASRRRCEAAGEDGQTALILEATEGYRRDLRNYMAMEELVHGGSPGGNEVVALTEARRMLAEGDVLVLYAMAGGRLRALVVRSATTAVVDLCSEKEAREVVEGLWNVVQSRGETVDVALALRLLVDPLSLPDDATRILLSPDGPLSMLPWMLLLPGREVVLAPSASALAVLRAEGGSPGRRVLALGAPDYEPIRKGCLLRAYGRRGVLGDLPGSSEEARAITREGDVLLLRDEASERNLRVSLLREERWRAIHFACHGLTNLKRPALTSLVLTPVGEDDGFLTVLEVFGLRVPADLVVLSACESGLGREVQGEGSLGLPAAFLSAGASRVLASLWKVDDDATCALIVKFYELWNPGDGPGLRAPEALREAQAFVRSHPRWRSPFYWAAWLLWGLPD
jgi:tetratricopeptide (TPR) repeat protein